ncbi:MAG: hypothetical protein WCY15_07320 [Phenylobacterium sp.]|jgi:hypothetical protein|uniref:hypothetical protein n=1 Tax=Phenylobacterium sp. TaxID=1871053 RepID=UPI002A368D25|nr:hypothetical protein [Phenylobacterium sp.]MDX9996418.1 hypothetical protein [Phenylobacterium sp.]
MNAPVQRATRLVPELLDDLAQEARWQALDLVARRGREAAPNLLRGQSADYAGSPLAWELLLGMALDQAAETIDAPAVDLSPLLKASDLPAERLLEIRAAAERLKGSARWVEELAARIDRNAGQLERVRLLRAHALLNERFWSDARIPADEATRARMLACAPQFRARADAAARRARGWRQVAGRLGLPTTLLR